MLKPGHKGESTRLPDTYQLSGQPPIIQRATCVYVLTTTSLRVTHIVVLVKGLPELGRGLVVVGLGQEPFDGRSLLRLKNKGTIGKDM